jgi:hypothetical protein
MMRTLLLVILMTLVAMASGLSFVVRAAAQAPPSAEMEFGCGGGPLMIASQELVLVACKAVATNTGQVTLVNPQLEFVPAATLPPPDLYLFWSETHDGVRSAPGEGQLTYDFGDIAAGGLSMIVLEIIVRSTHDFGADVALVGQPDQREYGRVTVLGSVTSGGGPAIPASLTREFESATPNMPSASYSLKITNAASVPYDDVSVELAPGIGVGASGAIDWKGGGEPGRFVADFGTLGGSATIDRSFRLAPEHGECETADPAVVITARQGGIVRRQPLIDEAASVGPCTTLGVGALPQGGSGPSGNGRGGLSGTAAGVAATGMLLFAMGATMRRRRRDPRHADRPS